MSTRTAKTRLSRDEIRARLEESALCDPGDGSAILATLGDIARSGNMCELARATGLTSRGLYKALSPNGNPTIGTILRVTKALDLQVKITA